MSAPTPEPTPTPDKPAEAQYELHASRRGLIMTYGVLKEHEGRYNALPRIPEGFKPVTGNYATVAAAAIKLNDAQTRSQFLDYIYAPEPRQEVNA